MKVISKQATHGTNYFYQGESDVYKAYVQHDLSYSIFKNGEYLCKIEADKFGIIDAVIRSGGDLTALNLSRNKQSVISKDGRYTFAYSYKKETGGVKVYCFDNENHFESQIWDILKFDYESQTQKEEQTKIAEEMIKAACEEYDATGHFKAYRKCSIEHSYSEHQKQNTLLTYDVTIEERVATLQKELDEIQQENKTLRMKLHEADTLLDYYRYEKCDEDTTCEYCGGKLERLYSDKTHSLFVGCPQCRKTSKSYNEHYKMLYEDGWLPDRWMENNISEDF